jgi:integrase/recombinase XerD
LIDRAEKTSLGLPRDEPEALWRKAAMMKYLTEREEKQLLRTVREVKGKKAERDSMILFLGFNTGIRLSEMIGLNVSDVRGKEKLYVRPETTKRTLRITQAVIPATPGIILKDSGQAGMTYKKRAVGRYIPLNKKLQSAIREFIKHKLTWRESIQDDAPLFISKKGDRLSRRAIQEVFAYWRDRAGLDGYTIHSMRHSFAKRLIERGIELATVQKLLGHASLGSTGVYIEAGYEEMQEAVEAR